ncbi:hypothetical protein Leryth_024597 [Lithospermum erythrorhizon]|nr:hypothetical protein Leryth_024597 [Lithospermum erythrorhizon]
MNEMHTPVTARRSMMNEMHTPMTARRSQPHSLLMSGKHLLADSKKYHDEEDTFSIASSVATSVRTVRSKVTVPMEPTFKSSERLARRKEFYTKLEEKHKALEAEKLEYVSRSKEEEEAAIKQLRKAMTYKANPVPNFYREGPPPKVELKKLPVTRAKSPNFTRRKSCGDAIKPSPDEKKSTARPTRHSIGVLKSGIASPATPKTKDLSTTRNVKGPSKLKDSNGSSKTKARPKQVKETAITPQPESKKVSPGIPVVETITSHLSEQSPDPVVVEEERNIAEAEVIKDVNMNSQTLVEA